MIPYDPTPLEIAEACEKIRAGWSPGELRRRSAWAESERWEPPAVEFDDEEPAEW